MINYRLHLLLLITLPAITFAAGGIQIQCCTVLHSPVTERINGQLAGIAINYLRNLEKETGYECSGEPLVINSNTNKSLAHTSLINRTFDCQQGIQSASDDAVCNCQLAAGGWILNKERYGKVQFLPPFVKTSFRVVIRHSDMFKKTDGPYFLSAFSLNVWLFIWGLILCFAFLKVLDKQFMPPDNSFAPLPVSEPLLKRIFHYLLKSQVPRRIRKALMSTMTSLLNHSPTVKDGYSPSTKHWVLNYIIFLCGLFLILTYESAMTANLVQENLLSKYKSIHDFQHCRLDLSRVCIAKGGAVEAFWRSSVMEYNGRDCNKKEPYWTTSYDESIHALLNHTCDYMFSEEMTAKRSTHREFCGKLVIVGEPAVETGMSFILPLSADPKFVDNLTIGTLKLREEGKLITAEDYLKVESGSCEIINPSTITLDKMATFFIWAYSACFLLIALMIFDPHSLNGSAQPEFSITPTHSMDDDAFYNREGDQVRKKPSAEHTDKYSQDSMSEV